MQVWAIGAVLGVLAVGWMPALPPRSLCYAALTVSVLLLRWQRAPAALALLGLSVGLCWAEYRGAQLLAARLPPALETEIVLLRGRVLEHPQRRKFSTGVQRQRFTFAVDQCLGGNSKISCAPRLRRVLLSYYGEIPLSAGERWQFSARLKRPWGLANPGSFNYQTWLAEHRIGATGVVQDKELLLLAGPGFWDSPYEKWRQTLSQALDQALGAGVEGAVIKALTIGDRSQLDYHSWHTFARYGLNHLIVISGLHVGLVAGLGMWLGRWAGALLNLAIPSIQARMCGRALAVLLAFVYSGLAGFALPTVRALIVIASVALLSMGGRRLYPARALLLAMLGIALIDPLASHNSGFWLSFAAVALIFYLLANWPAVQGWRALVLLQLVLSVGMGVLGSYWFGGASWLAPLANFLVIPVVSLALVPLCLLSAMLHPLLPDVAASLWQLAAVPVTWFVKLDAALTGLGLDFWISKRPGIGAVIALWAGLLLLVSGRGMPLRRLGVLLLLPILIPATAPLGENELELVVLDVGQGLSVLVRTRAELLLYDTGAGDPAGPNMATAVVIPYLQAQSAGPITTLVLSHGDNDHASGAQSLLRAWQVEKLWLGDPGSEEGLDSTVPQWPCLRGRKGGTGELYWRQLHPVAGDEAVQANNRSCVLLLEFKGFRILLTGDIEKPVEHELARLWHPGETVDIVLAPHHGSRTSSAAPLLNRIQPTHVVFSAGYHNRFQHPHPEVVRRYQRRGAAVYTTADSGALVFRVVAGELVEVTRWREKRKYFWH